MKRWFILLNLLLVIAAQTRGVDLVWESEFKNALATAAEEGHPVLLDFTAPWCQPCVLMDRTTFADENVRHALSGFKLVRIAYDTSPLLIARYRIQGIPAIILLNSQGEEIARRIGYQDPDRFLAWIEESGASSGPGLSYREAVLEKSAALWTAFQNAKGPDRTAAFEEMLATVSDPEASESRVAMKRTFEQMAKAYPDWMRARLADKRLLVRILVTNALSATDQLPADFDPWSRPLESRFQPVP